MLIILASGSPRRKELLAQARLNFEVIISDVEEKITKTKPEEVVVELSGQKCKAVSDIFTQHTPDNLSQLIVVGADTVVSVDNIILGKPKDAKDAFEMLMKLSGRTHEVYTGVTCSVLQYNSFTEGLLEVDSFSFYEETKVNMYPFCKYDALDYIESGEPMDKAGSYGIQGIGQRLVQSINGDYNNVVGFPLSRFIKELNDRDYISYD